MKTAPLHSSVDEPGTRVETETARRRAKKKRAATLARTHLSLLFGLEPETHVSDKPPAGGWSKRWPEDRARLQASRSRRASERAVRPLTFETTRGGRPPQAPPGRTAERRARGDKKKPRRGRPRRRRSAAEAPRRSRRPGASARFGVSASQARVRRHPDPADLRGVDAGRRRGARRSRRRGTLTGTSAVDNRTTTRRERDDPETRSGSVARATSCAAFRASAARRRVRRLRGREARERLAIRGNRGRDAARPSDRYRTRYRLPCEKSDACSVSSVAESAPSRALEYAERAVWADAASAEADAAERWAFVLEEAPDRARRLESAGTAPAGETDAFPTWFAVPRRRRRPAGTKPPARTGETVETRFARRARCDPADVIYSLASEGVWAEARKSEKRETNRAARKVAEKAPVEEKGGDASDSKNANRIQTEFKKKPGPGPRRRDVPPYHRFAASFVSAPPPSRGGGGRPRGGRGGGRDGAPGRHTARVRTARARARSCGDAPEQPPALGLRGVPKNCGSARCARTGGAARRAGFIRRPAVKMRRHNANSWPGNQTPARMREARGDRRRGARALEGQTRVTASVRDGERRARRDGGRNRPTSGRRFRIDGFDGGRGRETGDRDTRRSRRTRSARVREAPQATARAAAAARAERAARRAPRRETGASRRRRLFRRRDDDDGDYEKDSSDTDDDSDDSEGAMRASVRRGGQRDEPCRAAAAASRDGGCARRRDTRRGNDARLLGGSPRTSSAAHRAFGRDDVGEGDRRAKNVSKNVSSRSVRALRRDVRVGRP